MSIFSTATNYPVGTEPGFVVVGDFNKDGKPDIATANYGSKNISILLGTGTGSFGTATNFSVGLSPFSLTLGDFNNDGNLDIASVMKDDSTDLRQVAILLGNGKGSFGTPTSFDTEAVSYSIGVGDFNSNGKLDLVTISRDSSDISIILGRVQAALGLLLNLMRGENRSLPSWKTLMLTASLT